MILKICVGSACHIKGSNEIIEIIQKCITKEQLEEKITLKASFCLGKCTEAVSAVIEGEDGVFSLTPESTADFFEKIMKRVI